MSIAPLLSAAKATIGTAFRLLDAATHRGAVVVYYNWPDFAHKAEALADLLRRRGFRVVVRTGDSFVTRARIRHSRAVHVGFWNEYTFRDLPARYVFYNAEPLSRPRWANNPEWFAAMRGAVEVWGYAANHARYIEALGVPYRYVPFGYAPAYEASFREHTAGVAPGFDADVIFVGWLSERRKALLARMEALGLRVRAVTYEQPLRGAALDAAYARAKIVLSAFGDDDPEAQVVDLARLDRLLSNGRFVLHERPPDAHRDPEFERHVPTVPYGELAERCAYFAREDAERERVATDAREWFRTRRAMSDSLPYDRLRTLVG